MNRKVFCILFFIATIFFCNKKNTPTQSRVSINPKNPSLNNVSINNIPFTAATVNVNSNPRIKISFTEPLDKNSLSDAIQLKDNSGIRIPLIITLQNKDSDVVVQPSIALNHLTKYNLSFATTLKSASGGNLKTAFDNTFATSIDSSRKFPIITDEELLTKVQQQTFKYFWDFAHPISGLARERNSSGDIVTSGGSGFGIMCLLVGIERGFISKTAGLYRMKTIVSFLKNTAQTFHGAYPHWFNGATGVVVPFGTNDNGADLVETSFLIQGLLCARQYFNGNNNEELGLRNDINLISNRVEWNWFQQNNQDVLYWHWSNDKGWVMNHKIQGWNECLITYVLAASSTSYPITKSVYDLGWAKNGAIKNGKTFYNYTLPLGEDFGGPLFFEHYSFLGINPTSLTDSYADYKLQTKNHTLINYNYCKTNPKNYYGYSDSVWGLTASDIKNGYTASSPTNDQGFIAPTAAISSFPYTPNESMAALQFYYYVLGDKIWKEYGFVDAFSLDVLKNNGAWFADSYLAIDQGPVIIMIENYRTGLLWRLFMSCPEVKSALKKLQFTSPDI